jgi:hypothetical protein
MKLDPVLLSMACSWSMKAYNETNRDATKIESGLTSTTAFVIQRKTIDIIVFRGTQQVATGRLTCFRFLSRTPGACVTPGLSRPTRQCGMTSSPILITTSER